MHTQSPLAAAVDGGARANTQVTLSPSGAPERAPFHPAESPAEHVRNALQLVAFAQVAGGVLAADSQLLADVAARLRAALERLEEAPATASGYPINTGTAAERWHARATAGAASLACSCGWRGERTPRPNGTEFLPDGSTRSYYACPECGRRAVNERTAAARAAGFPVTASVALFTAAPRCAWCGEPGGHPNTLGCPLVYSGLLSPACEAGNGGEA